MAPLGSDAAADVGVARALDVSEEAPRAWAFPADLTTAPLQTIDWAAATQAPAGASTLAPERDASWVFSRAAAHPLNLSQAMAALGLGAQATAYEARAAYRMKMAQVHPDRVPPSLQHQAQAQAALLNCAWNLVRHPTVAPRPSAPRLLASGAQTAGRQVGSLQLVREALPFSS